MMTRRTFLFGTTPGAVWAPLVGEAQHGTGLRRCSRSSVKWGQQTRRWSADSKYCGRLHHEGF
jgi:hypothetical protein